MNEKLEERKIQLLEALNSKFDEVLSQLKTLNSTNKDILEKLDDIQNDDVNSISDICDNIMDMRGPLGDEEPCTLLNLKEAIEKK